MDDRSSAVFILEDHLLYLCVAALFFLHRQRMATDRAFQHADPETWRKCVAQMQTDAGNALPGPLCLSADPYAQPESARSRTSSKAWKIRIRNVR